MRRLVQIVISLLSVQVLTVGISSSVFSQSIGMEAYTYRNSFKKDAALTLDTLKSMNIKDIELSDLCGKTPSEFRKMLDERGIFCSSFGSSYMDILTKTREIGQIAKILGAKYIMVAWIPHKAPFTIKAAQKAVTDFNNVGKILKEEFGIVFCYHNHGYEFQPYKEGTLFDYIVEKTNPRYVSFEIDILWTFFPGIDPVWLIRKYGKRFKLMHLKDLRKGVVGNFSGNTSTENDVVLGTGQLDIPSVLKEAKRVGIKHCYIEDESPIYYKQVPNSLMYLQNLKR